MIESIFSPLLDCAPAIIAAMDTYPIAANKYLLLVAMVCCTGLGIAWRGPRR